MDAFRRLFAVTCVRGGNESAAVAAESGGAVTTEEKVRVGLGCSKSTLFSRDIVSHSNCEFSSAALGANTPSQDYSQIIIGQNATFVGIYDGDCGTEAANYVNTVLFDHILRISGERGSTMSCDIIKEAKIETEKGYVDFARRTFETNRKIAKVRSSIMVGIIWKGTLYVANWGHSRAVLGRFERRWWNNIEAMALTDRNNAYSTAEEIELVRDKDKFVIFASRGLWEFLCYDEAARIVHNNPRPGIAKKLIRSALEVAAERRNVTYKEVKTRKLIGRTERKIHDDITVVVVFFKHNAADDEQPSFDFSAVGY